MKTYRDLSLYFGLAFGSTMNLIWLLFHALDRLQHNFFISKKNCVLIVYYIYALIIHLRDARRPHTYRDYRSLLMLLLLCFFSSGNFIIKCFHVLFHFFFFCFFFLWGVTHGLVRVTVVVDKLFEAVAAHIYFRRFLRRVAAANQ